MFAVVWDNGHATGTFPARYESYDEARRSAQMWRIGMAFEDDDPPAAYEVYTYDIIEVKE